MSTTKLTRKEIASDPIHDALVGTVETIRARARILSLAALGVLIIAVAVYLGLNYLRSRDSRAQQELAKGLDVYHAAVNPSAKSDPNASGSEQVFPTEEAKYRAASAIFASPASRTGSSKVKILARYYLGLCQKQLGQKNEAIATLEGVGNNTSVRTVAYAAKKALAAIHAESGDHKKAVEILRAVLNDPQCDLPKEDLQVDLARVYVAQGNREEALKILKQAQEAGGGSMLQTMIFQELNRLQGGPGNNPQP